MSESLKPSNVFDMAFCRDCYDKKEELIPLHFPPKCQKCKSTKMPRIKEVVLKSEHNKSMEANTILLENSNKIMMKHKEFEKTIEGLHKEIGIWKKECENKERETAQDFLNRLWQEPGFSCPSCKSGRGLLSTGHVCDFCDGTGFNPLVRFLVDWANKEYGLKEEKTQ